MHAGRLQELQEGHGRLIERTNSERPRERRGMEQMAAQLCQRLVGVECFASGRERDPLVLEIAEGGVQ